MNISEKSRKRPGSATLYMHALRLSLLASVILPMPAFAQSEIETVTVTAEKRDEFSQKVPISISVITPSQLTAAQITSTVDLPQLASSLITITGANANSFQTPYIRGVGSSSTLNGIDASVATYIDGVYQPFKQGNLFDLDDIERIEVLKGPQGTLFGRNATGGAISIITMQPDTDSFAGNAEVSYGRFDETMEKAYVNMPITENLAANFAITAQQGGDYLYNAYLGNRFGGTNSFTTNGKIKWTPVAKLEVTAGFIYEDRKQSSDVADVTLVPGSTPVGALLGGAGSYTNYVGLLNFDPIASDRTFEGSLHVKYSFPGFDLVSISAYQADRSLELLDYDVTDANVFSFDDHDSAQTYTQEVQLLSNEDGAFQWIVGGYYIHDRESYDPLGELFVAPAPVDIDSVSKVTGYAGFGQATYDFGEGTKVTAGFRYSTEDRTLTGIETIPAFSVTLAGPIALQKTFAKPTWRFSVDHSFTDNILAYLSYNRGFKSGAFNPTAIDPLQQPVKSEVLDAYEAGAKTRWLDNRLQLNGAVYYYNYTNIQVQRVDPSVSSAAILEAAGAAELYGFDGDLIVIPVDGLQLHAGIGLEHSEYTSYTNASGFAYIGGFGVPETYPTVAGSQLLYAPNVTFNLGADYSFGFADTSSLEFTGNYAFSSRYKEVVGDGNISKAYGVLNGSITWNAPNDKFFVRLWGKNLTNQEDVGTLLNTLSYQKQLLEPITYGLSAGVKF